MTSGANADGPEESVPDDQAPARGWRAAFAIYARPRVVGMAFLGFSSGLPFLLVFSTLSAWLTQAGVSRTTIGFFSWLGIMYSIKVVWAPVIDRLPLPVLTHLLGRRRAWMLLAQLSLMIGLAAMALSDPGMSLTRLAWFGLLVAFSSATQDVAIDAWRIEAIEDSAQGAMAAAYQAGYRIALLTAGAGAFFIASGTSWPTTYGVMAALVGIGMVTVLIVAEPEASNQPRTRNHEPWVAAHLDRLALRAGALRDAYGWILTAVVSPLSDFFQRYGRAAAVILAFVAVFRVCDITLGVMANPFYLDMHYSLDQIASVSKIFGVLMTLGGAAVGGMLVVRFGIMRPLWAAAILTALANLVFAWLATLGQAATPPAFIAANAHTLASYSPLASLISGTNVPLLTPTDPGMIPLALTVSAENLAGGLAGSAFIAYLSSLTNTAYTATQYALFSSLMTLPGKFLGGFSGWMVDHYGYFWFFLATSLAGLPAILLVTALQRLHRNTHQVPAATSEAKP